MEILTQEVSDRLWSGIDIRGENECWPWQRYCNRDGYGKITIDGRAERVHRIVWILENETIPNLYQGRPATICHTCDSPPCCNPNHLFLGNQLINRRDCGNKGRAKGGNREGQNNTQSKLTNDQILEIRSLSHEGWGQQQIADYFGITQSTVSHIITEKTWSHLR